MKNQCVCKNNILNIQVLQGDGSQIVIQKSGKSCDFEFFDQNNIIKICSLGCREIHKIQASSLDEKQQQDLKQFQQIIEQLQNSKCSEIDPSAIFQLMEIAKNQKNSKPCQESYPNISSGDDRSTDISISSCQSRKTICKLFQIIKEKKQKNLKKVKKQPPEIVNYEVTKEPKEVIVLQENLSNFSQQVQQLPQQKIISQSLNDEIKIFEEKLKRYIIDADEAHKITPNLSDEWIKKITTVKRKK